MTRPQIAIIIIVLFILALGGFIIYSQSQTTTLSLIVSPTRPLTTAPSPSLSPTQKLVTPTLITSPTP